MDILSKGMVSSPPPLSLSQSSFDSPGKADPHNADLQPLDLDELEPLPPTEAQHWAQSKTNSSSNPLANRRKSAESRRESRSSLAANHDQASRGSYSARYVTVSAILSRSGAAIPLSEMEGDRLNTRFGKDVRRRSSGRKYSDEYKGAILDTPPKFTRRKTFGGGDGIAKRRASNGSALEALGALLLQRDSSGKVSNLSFTRYQQENGKGKGRHGLSSVSKAWLQGVTEAGAARLGIHMPKRSDEGHTIAERRARRRGPFFQSFVDPRVEREDDDDEDIEGEEGRQFSRVGTKSWHPTFEVGKHRQRVNDAMSTSPHPGPASISDLSPDLNLSHDASSHPSTAGVKMESSIFGIGSAFALNDPPEAPPSPIDMPGAWAIGGPGWNSSSGDWREEGALLLPPPLLDDQGSDAKSFEGLLGVRRMREQERARKQLEKLKARNRPAHKVGMLTAFSNFVKAAHAADKASKAAASGSKPVDMLSRRHTEPVRATVNRSNSNDEDDEFEANIDIGKEEHEYDSNLASEAHLAGLDMKRSSSQPRHSLESMGRSLNTVYEAGALHTFDQGPGPAQTSRRSSTTTSNRSSTFEALTPRAPKLLPIHMSITTPDTPLVLDPYESYYEAARRRDPSAPPTPRLGPTLLSLPPSPFINSEEDADANNFWMHLSMTPINGPPGTPRLAPTALEIAPSPFPLSPTFTPFVRSPRSSTFATNGQITPMELTSPFSVSPLRSPTVAAATEAGRRATGLRRRTTQEVEPGTPTRMTPSAMIDIANNKESGRSKHVQLPDRKSKTESETSAKTPAETSEDITRPTNRSFLLWFLFGDLGLGTRSTIAAKANGSPLPPRAKKYSRNYGALLGLAAHVYGFSVFILAHMVDLGYRIAEFLSMTFWFLRWVVLNLTGQTVLARCVIDAYGLVQKEWQTVSREDHEGKGVKSTRRGVDVKDELQSYKGLSRWQVMKGMIELVCLQDVTRERYLEEGAGLEELQGWKSKDSKNKEKISEIQRVDLGAKREADRRAILSFDSDADENDEYDDDDDEEEEDDSDNDDMVVTRQGPEILEFTKTPKTEPKSYFYQSEDSIPIIHKSQRELRSTMEGNRLLVKTIKWASRLAISAYGLHVTLVDLPATFTPSGNRFSRQTFAHLSRLHHEDVLHADIQTLDSDAYSPTFYLVRDLARKVVVVSVRGTQSLQDIIVDLEMVVDQVELNDNEKDSEKLYCHAGVLRAAKALISRESTLFKTLSEALEENKGFGIVFTGHSLGGAIASTVVLLLSKYDVVVDEEKEVKEEQKDQGKWVTHEESGLPAGRSIRAITFAHPATVNANLANRAAKGKVPLVISVVLGSDIIPRCGHGQARELRRVLGGLSRVRKRKEDLFHHNKRETEGEEDARIHIVTSWWRWKSIKRKGESATKQELKKAKQIEKDLWRLRCDVEDDLYAAIKKRSTASTDTMDQSGKKSGKGEEEEDESNQKRPIPPSPWIGPSQRAKAPLHQLASRRQAIDAITLQNEESLSASGILVPAGGSILIYEGKLYRVTSPLSFFSLPDFHVSVCSSERRELPKLFLTFSCSNIAPHVCRTLSFCL